VTCPPNRCTVPIMNSSLSRRPSQARWRVSCRSPWPGDRRIPRATRQVRGHHRIVVTRAPGQRGTGWDRGGTRRPRTGAGRPGCYRSSSASVAASSWSSAIGDRRSARAGLARADLAGPAHPAHPPADEPARRRASGVHRRDLPPRLQQLRLAGELAEVRAPAGALATSAARYPRRGTCKDGFTIAGTSRHVQDRSCRAVTASRHSGALCGPRRCGHRSRCVQWPIRRSSMPLPEPPGKGARHEAIPLTGELSPGQRAASPAP
jgi:hypothetical protein